MWTKIRHALPRGYSLDEADWQRRHRMLLWVLGLHVPGLAVFGLAVGQPPQVVFVALLVPVACVGLGWVARRYRRTASVTVTAGLVYCSAVLVVFSRGAIEAHFHFFIIIGFIALYQDWAPFLFNILFTVVSHGIGSAWQQNLIFGTSAGAANPWLWSLIHGVAVLFACVGMMLFWRVTEDSQREKDALSRQLSDAEIGRRQFTSDLLTNLARRNQTLLYRQLDIINQLEESERDPDALAELFALDHLATRVRRNAESLLVLSGEQPARTWGGPVALRDVLRAAIAETEDLQRVEFSVDEFPAVAGHTVTDLTHLIAELTENAVRFSPPDTTVIIRSRPDRRDPGGQVLVIEDWGIGMPAAEMAAANALLATPPEVDLSVSQRLGFHVVARLAARHAVRVSLRDTPGSGITAAVALPAELFVSPATVGATSSVSELRPAADFPHPAADGAAQRTRRSTPAPSLGPVPAGVGSGYGLGRENSHRSLDPVTAVAQVSEPVRQSKVPVGMGGDQPWTGSHWWQQDAPTATATALTDEMAGLDASAWASGAPPCLTSPPATPPDRAPQRITPSVEAAYGEDRRVGPPRVVTSRPTPTPRSLVAAVPPQGAGDSPGEARLRQRVPQSHLSPHLLEPDPRDAPAARAAAPASAAEAAAALSRYQAKRAAAQADSAGGGMR